MTRRLTARAALGLGLSMVLLVGAMLIPSAWYDALPHTRGLAPVPIRGTTLLQLLLVFQAVCIASLSLFGWRWLPPAGAARTNTFALRTDDADDLNRPQARRWLALIAMLAFALRVYGIGADLWIDELLTLTRFAREPVAVIIGSFRTSNNHLLISLLMKASITVFGEHEWSLRLAAVIFGVATIPALYHVARLAMSRRASLASALLLAVSYHHVFFSQNARGYSAYVLFALLGTRALIDALRDDQSPQWLRYGAATLLGFLALLNTVFVISAQLLVVSIVLLRVRHRGGALRPLLVRVITVFVVTGFMCLEVFAIALPEAYLVITTVFTRQASGLSLASGEVFLEFGRRLVEGFGVRHWFAAVPFLALAVAGIVMLWRRHWAVTTLLALPGLLTVAVILARGFTFSPRHFLLWLPLAVLTAVVTIDAVVHRLQTWSARRRHVLAMTVVGALALTSLVSLKRYYTVPKQPYVTTLRYVEQTRNANDLVIVVHPAQYGAQFYSRKLGIPWDRDYIVIRNPVELDSALTIRSGRGVRLITTLERGLAVERPELMARLNADWTRDTTFAATVGGGELSVWSARASTRVAPLPSSPR